MKTLPLNLIDVLATALNTPADDIRASIAPRSYMSYSRLVQWLNDEGYPTRIARRYHPKDTLFTKRRPRTLWPILHRPASLVTLTAYHHCYIAYQSGHPITEPHYHQDKSQISITVYPKKS